MGDLTPRQRFIVGRLGGKSICERCGATLETMGVLCNASLDSWCPGFEAIERAEQDFLAAQEETK